MTWEIHQPPNPGLDSFEWLKALPNDSVDHIITDPPYPDFVQDNMKSGTAFKKFVEGGGGGSVPKVTLPFAALDRYDFAVDMVRVARRWVLAFCAVEDFGNYRAAVTAVAGPKAWIRGGIWYKPNSMGQLTGDRPAAAYEGIAIMHRPTKKVWQGRGSYAYWSADSDEFPSAEAHFVCNGTRGETARHPNQKPLALCLELVAKFTHAGELVVDPFAGSGRIGEACVLLGRDYLGIEQDPAWVEAARARLTQAEGAPRLTDESCLRLCAAPKSRQSA